MISTRLRVKELLRERRWTTKVLAEKTGMSESYLTHIKNGTRRWNQDALYKLAVAFELEPIDIFDHQRQRTDTVRPAMMAPQGEAFPLNVAIVPVVGQIPAEPSEYNNQVVQESTGHKGKFVPVVVKEDNKSMFCLYIEDNSLNPKFSKGDLLVVTPGMWTNSGDMVAVEYGTPGDVQRIIAQINYMDDLVVLESVNHKKAPVALVRNKDYFKIIGKVTHRYQELDAK